MKNLLLPSVIALSLLSWACGSSDPCSATSKCSADPVQTSTSAGAAACKAATASGAKCVTEYKAFANCAIDNQKCGSDNKTDGTATTAALAANCVAQATALSTCQAAQ